MENFLLQLFVGLSCLLLGKSTASGLRTQCNNILGSALITVLEDGLGFEVTCSLQSTDPTLQIGSKVFYNGVELPPDSMSVLVGSAELRASPSYNCESMAEEAVCEKIIVRVSPRNEPIHEATLLHIYCSFESWSHHSRCDSPTVNITIPPTTSTIQEATSTTSLAPSPTVAPTVSDTRVPATPTPTPQTHNSAENSGGMIATIIGSLAVLVALK